MAAQNRALHRALFGVWGFLGLAVLLAGGWVVIRPSPYGGVGSEVDMLVFILGAVFVLLCLFALVGHGLASRGSRAGGIVVVLVCGIPLLKTAGISLRMLADGRMPVFVLLPVAFLGLNVWSGIRTIIQTRS